MMRKTLTILLILPLFLCAQQRPFINNVTPTTVEAGSKVSISGSNLTNVTQVSFGGVASTGVTVVSDNLVEATVPAGANHGSVIVRTTANLFAESSQQFFVSFSSTQSSTWKAEFLESIAPNTDAYDICLCDLNSDGLNDVILTHNIQDNSDNEPQATVFQNNSTTSSEAFTDIGLPNITDTDGFISTTCADIDGDGKPEAIFTSNSNSSNQIFVYSNTSSGTVSLNSNPVRLSLPPDQNDEIRVTRRIKASDIDGDGKLDLVVGNEKDNTIHIFPNNSSVGSFSFGAAVEITVSNASSTGSIELGDLDNDGKIDIVVVPAGQANEQIYILRNQSIPGSVSMSLQEGITTTDRRRNIVIADFDNDGLNDLAATADLTTSNVGDETVEIYENTTSGNTITFSAASPVSIPSNLPWGIKAGDVNGDGLVDLTVSAIGGAGTSGAIYVLENNSSGGISFNSPIALAVNVDARNVSVGDLSGDSKPDIAYSHDVRTGEEGDLGVRINQTCIVPVIKPGSFTFCPGTDFTLSATNVTSGNYSWSITSGTGTVVSQSGNEATFNITSNSDATISLQITGQAGCTSPPTTSFTATFEPGSVTPSPSITVNDTNGGSICAGDEITLSTSTSFNNYLWTLPNGSTSTNATITISSASAANAGEYQLTVRNNGSCNSPVVTQNLSVSEPPILEITNDDLDNFCSNTSVTLQVPDYSSDFNYQWYRDGSALSGETGTTYTANQSGTYRVDVINATDGCVSETADYTVTAVSPPTSVANGPSEICTDATASFTSASTGQGSFALEYEWTIEDASNNVVHTATSTNLDFAFTTAGTYEVILNTTYNAGEVLNGNNCEGSTSLSITATAPPTISFDQSDLTAKCQADVVELGLSSPTGGGISAYSWTIRNAADNSVIRTATNDTLQVNTPVGIDTVWAVVDITTSIGCQVRDSIRIRNFQSDLDISSTDFTSVLSFDSALLEDATAINLSANNAASNISWSPAENFSDPSGTNTIFFPQNPVSTVTLTATDNNGCNVSTEIRVVLDNIRPKRTFSPNGDGMNDCWEILNIGDLGTENGCEVYVFDSRGRNIIVKSDFEPNDNCVWDGNFNSSPVPEGVYYYVLKCDASEFTKSGSILLAR